MTFVKWKNQSKGIVVPRTSEKSRDSQNSGIGHSVIRGLVTAGQWFRLELYCLSAWITKVPL